MQPKITETKEFLKKVRKAIKDKNYCIKIHKLKYRTTLASLGIVMEDVLDDIYNLTEFDFWEKRKDDNENYSGYVWICKKMLHSNKIYIKLKIKVDENGKLLIMSYHFEGMHDR